MKNCFFFGKSVPLRTFFTGVRFVCNKIKKSVVKGSKFYGI